MGNIVLKIKVITRWNAQLIREAKGRDEQFKIVPLNVGMFLLKWGTSEPPTPRLRRSGTCTTSETRYIRKAGNVPDYLIDGRYFNNTGVAFVSIIKSSF